MIRKGRFITIEGGEGVGKTTLIHSVKSWLESRGIAVVLTREPGGTPLGEELRRVILELDDRKLDPRAELLLFFAARLQHIQTKILPTLDQGSWILCDRFMDSTIVYQGVATGLGIDYVKSIWKAIVGQIDCVPVCTLLLDCPVEKAFQRIQARFGENNRFEEKGHEFHQLVRSAFLDLAKAHPKRIHVLNADQPPETLAQSTYPILDRLIHD